MYLKKMMGPDVEPRGNPHSIFRYEESLFIDAYR